MPNLILMRHGASMWNEKNRFTGWVDVPLSKKGEEEARTAGLAIKDLPIDEIYTSSLIRSITTALLAMNQHASQKIPVIDHTGEGKLEEWSHIHDKAALKELIPLYRHWELNERMYGELQGLDKDEARTRFGREQVHIWRRSFDVPPPKGESLKLTLERTLPFFKTKIVPSLKQGKNVFICAHGNSLRSIVMWLDNLTENQVLNLEIATGEPLIYDSQKLNLSR